MACGATNASGESWERVASAAARQAHEASCHAESTDSWNQLTVTNTH
jgi:hypothetical protein